MCLRRAPEKYIAGAALDRTSEHRKTQSFENCICFRPQVRGGRHLLCWVQLLRLTLPKGRNRVGAFLHIEQISPELSHGALELQARLLD
jgi:hypothetical protein